MKTVQRSPSLIGCALESAIRANSSLMRMPSSLARSSRKLPVPAAQASFIAKSTTMPSSRLMNLASWPPISKIVSTPRPRIVRSMNVAPVLCAVISSLIVSAPTSSPISSRPDPVVPTPRMRILPPRSRSISRRPRLTTSIGRAVGPQVDLLEDVAVGVDARPRFVLTDPMSMPRNASRVVVDVLGGIDRRHAGPAAGRRCPSRAAATSGTGARRPATRSRRERRRVAPSGPARELLGEEGRIRWRRTQAWSCGTISVPVVPAERRLERLHDAAVGRDAADEHDRRARPSCPW